MLGSISWSDRVRVREFTPRTKYIALKCHDFRQFVSKGTVTINPIGTLEQTADILTKPLDGVKFTYQ